MNKVIGLRIQTILFLITILVVGVAAFLLFKKTEKQLYSQVNINQIMNKENLVPVAVLGSGPAGLSAALYGARSGFYTVIFEGPKPGGQLMGTSFVENWPGLPKKLGADLIKSLKEQAQEFGAEIMADTIKSVDASQWPYILTTENGLTLHALTVIIASGASAKMLGIPGEKEYFGWEKGVSTCAICDAPFYKDKEVLVIGGGDSAAEEAMQLAPYAKKVTVLVRRDVMRASAIMQERLRAYDNISIQFNTIPVEVKGDGKKMTELIATVDGQQKSIPADGIFLAIGHEPNSAVVKNVVAMDADGFIKLKEGHQETSVPAIYAAGDVADRRYRQAGIASGDGIKAALDAVEFLRMVGFNDAVAAKVEGKLLSVEGGPGRTPLQELKSIADIEKELKSDMAVMLDFYTDVCATCMQLLPTLEMIATEFKERLKIYKVNLMKVSEAASKFGVKGVPTLLIFKKGEQVARASEAMPLKTLKAFVEKALA
jgi:thioredoxin reductase (NADPH)